MPSSARLSSLDFLRGLVMVLMALDHTRGMVGLPIDPTDLAQTTPALFLTRWVTHFCAPVFVFLAGTSAFLYGARGKTKGELSQFLWRRGLWLIVLEFTLVRFGWSFRLGSPFLVGQVIWVLGCSMIVLAGLVHLPVKGVAALGIATIALHNLLDGFKAPDFGQFAWLWGILRSGYNFKLPGGIEFRPLYALIPWAGVMAAGYGFGPLLLRDGHLRRRALLGLGLGLSGAFLLIRLVNVYGDPRPWASQKDFLFTCFSFVNCTKYPPSFLFLLMTLGPSILFLAFLERGECRRRREEAFSVQSGGRSPEPTQSQRLLRLIPENLKEGLTGALIIFGRVPLFYYLLHIPLIHLLAALFSPANWRLALGSFYFTRPPPESGYGHELWAVYMAWICAAGLLFPVCRWFAGVKQRRRDSWLSYL